MSLDEALRKIEDRVVPVHACERLPIRECLDRVNNEVVLSPHQVPPHANSAMDGFALALSSLDERLVLPMPVNRLTACAAPDNASAS